MRFALMIEPQQGLTLRRPARDRQARRGRRASRPSSGPTTTRASRARPASRRPTPGRSSPGSPARPTTDRARRARLAGHVPARPATSPRSSTTVDEMSGGRVEVGRRRRLERAEHRQLGLPVPADRRARRPARGDSSRSSTACGASPTAGRSTASTRSRSRTRCSTRSRSTSRPAADPIGGARPRLLVGGRGIAAVVPDRGPLRGRVQPVVRRRRTGARRRSPRSTPPARDRARPGDA